MGKEDATLGENKIQYLQMIQVNIGRMNTNSAIFKGLSITLLVGLALNELNFKSFILCLIPLFIFCFMDMYYLYLEKCYIKLYNNVRLGKKDIDFSLAPSKYLSFKYKTIKYLQCFLSPSVFIFYIVLIIFLILKFTIKN